MTDIVSAIDDVLDGNEYVPRGIPRTPTEVVDLLFGDTDNSDWLTGQGKTFCDCPMCSAAVALFFTAELPNGDQELSAG